MGRRARGLCLWQPPHVCLCGSAELPGVEAWLWRDDCYSTSVGFKNAFLMGMHFTGRSSKVWEANITATGYRSSACAVVRRRVNSGNSLPSAAAPKNNREALENLSDWGFLEACSCKTNYLTMLSTFFCEKGSS